MKLPCWLRPFITQCMRPRPSVLARPQQQKRPIVVYPWVIEERNKYNLFSFIYKLQYGKYMFHLIFSIMVSIERNLPNLCLNNHTHFRLSYRGCVLYVHVYSLCSSPMMLEALQWHRLLLPYSLYLTSSSIYIYFIQIFLKYLIY